jgi:hypothetical protein
LVVQGPPVYPDYQVWSVNAAPPVNEAPPGQLDWQENKDSLVNEDQQGQLDNKGPPVYQDYQVWLVNAAPPVNEAPPGQLDPLENKAPPGSEGSEDIRVNKVHLANKDPRGQQVPSDQWGQ